MRNGHAGLSWAGTGRHPTAGAPWDAATAGRSLQNLKLNF